MRTRILAALVAVLLVVPAAAHGQAGVARATLETWIESMNSLSDDELDEYVNTAFTDAFYEQVSREQARTIHRQLRAVGDYSIHTVETDTGATIVALLETSGGSWFRAQMVVTGDPPKISGFLIQPAAEPTDEELRWDDVSELASSLVERFDLPGLAIAWVRPGQEMEVGVAGRRAVDSDAPVQASDRFHIGSITKSMTSTVLARLVEEGELEWDTTLAELLPDAADTPYANATLADLVRHQARIQQHLTFNGAEMSRLNDLEGTPTQQRAAYVAEVLALDPLEPGFAYSNAGYAMAGYIGEAASGRSWKQLLHEELFGPLDLQSCEVGWPASPEHPDQPRGHYGSGEDKTVQAFGAYELGGFMEPAGDVHCSALDLARYGVAHLAGLDGEDGFLRAETIQELHRTGASSQYAAGWGVDAANRQHGHNGSAGTFFANLVIDRDDEIVIAFLTNAGMPDGQLAANAAVEAIMERYGS